MNSVTLKEILIFHKKIIQNSGGSNGVRDLSLVYNALNRAFVTFDGKDLYKETNDKIATITYNLIKNSGFVDVNKRIGIAVMLILLWKNNINITYNQKELVEFGLRVDNGVWSEQDIKIWIENH